MVMYDWESEFKTKEKSIWTKEKIAPQHLFTAFLSNLKGGNNSIQSTTFFKLFFMKSHEIISWYGGPYRNDFKSYSYSKSFSQLSTLAEFEFIENKIMAKHIPTEEDKNEEYLAPYPVDR